MHGVFRYSGAVAERTVRVKAYELTEGKIKEIGQSERVEVSAELDVAEAVGSAEVRRPLIQRVAVC